MGKLKTLWRTDTTKRPDIALPVYQRSIGHVFREGHEHEYNPDGRNFVELYWGIKGKGEVVIQGKKFIFSENDVFFYLPYEPHNLRSTGQPWEYRWITFDGPGAKDFILSYNFPRSVFQAGKCPENLFVKQENLLRDMSPYAWREMVSVICSILAQAGGMVNVKTPSGSLVKEIVQICKEHFHDPELNVNALAGQLGMCRSSILRTFQKSMHMSPSEYLMKLRLQKAISLLMERNLTLKEIAFRCGFADPAYFSRLIRKRFGMSPSKIRAGGQVFDITDL